MVNCVAEYVQNNALSRQYHPQLFWEAETSNNFLLFQHEKGLQSTKSLQRVILYQSGTVSELSETLCSLSSGNEHVTVLLI